MTSVHCRQMMFEILTLAKNLPEVNWEGIFYVRLIWTLEFVYPPGKYPESLESKGLDSHEGAMLKISVESSGAGDALLA